MIGIVDYGMGNLGSVKRKMDLLGIDSIISDSPDSLRNTDKLILPGVGHFERAVKELKNRNLWMFLNDQVLVIKKPILGICLGMQLMAKHSEEGDCEGLGWLDAEVVRFQVKDTLQFKIPHIGWNTIIPKKQSRFFNVDGRNKEFYFVHSYHMKCNDPTDILNETIYENPFVSAIQRENIIAVQYHPEKSHEQGMQFLQQFVNE